MCFGLNDSHQKDQEVPINQYPHHLLVFAWHNLCTTHKITSQIRPSIKPLPKQSDGIDNLPSATAHHWLPNTYLILNSFSVVLLFYWLCHTKDPWGTALESTLLYRNSQHDTSTWEMFSCLLKERQGWIVDTVCLQYNLLSWYIFNISVIRTTVTKIPALRNVQMISISTLSPSETSGCLVDTLCCMIHLIPSVVIDLW